MEDKTLRAEENSIRLAFQELRTIGRTAFSAAWIPIPLILLAISAFFMLNSNWYRDIFLVLILTVFIIAQLLAQYNLASLKRSVRHASSTLKALRSIGDEPDLKALQTRLLHNTPPGYLRDLLLRWVDLGLKGETSGSEAVLENASERRGIRDDGVLSIHVSLNRTTLKLGFIGTLIGLIMTFPPMKRAILGLGEGDGELGFIRDIAAAIEGDEYAILTTLVATGLSILIELITIQILQRAYGGFDTVSSHLHDWNITTLQPWIRKNYGPEAKQEQLLERQAKMDAVLLEAQATMDENLRKLVKAMGYTRDQIEAMGRLQSLTAERIRELGEFEKQYRSFMKGKQLAAAPAHLQILEDDKN